MIFLIHNGPYGLAALSVNVCLVLYMFCKVHENMISFLEEGRLLQVTAGIKVGSRRKSVDGTENGLDTIITPL